MYCCKAMNTESQRKERLMNETDNMKLWDQVCETNPAITKAVSIGRRFTTVLAQCQVKRATELWGPMGVAWGVKDEKFAFLEATQIVYYQAILYYPDGNLPIHSDDEVIYRDGKRKGKYNEDVTKKIATDALTKGLSKLGFNSDIFEGKYDDNKYVAKMKAKFGDSGNVDTEPDYKTMCAVLPDPTPDEAGRLVSIFELIKGDRGTEFKFELAVKAYNLLGQRWPQGDKDQELILNKISPA